MQDGGNVVYVNARGCQVGLILYLEIVEYGFVVVLCGEACVDKVARGTWPFVQASIVIHLDFIGNDERYDIVIEALLKHDKSADTSVTILKWMNSFKCQM